MMEHLQFGSKRFEFTLSFVKRKTLAIKVHPDMRVEVMAPIDTEKEKVIKHLKLKAPWILQQIEQFKSFLPATPIRTFENGETPLYLGRQYRLKIIPDTVNVIKVYRGQLCIHAVNSSKDELKNNCSNGTNKKQLWLLMNCWKAFFQSSKGIIFKNQ